MNEIKAGQIYRWSGSTHLTHILQVIDIEEDKMINMPGIKLLITFETNDNGDRYYPTRYYNDFELDIIKGEAILMREHNVK